MLLGDVELADPEALPFGNHQGKSSNVFMIPRPGYVRVLTADPDPPADQDTPVTLQLFQATIDHVLGRHVEIRHARWLTRFGDAARQAERSVHGRVVLGWKLAATVRGTAPDHLLASYHTERHAAGARLLDSTRAQVELAEQGAPLASLLTRVASHPGGNRAFAETLTGLDTTYDMYPTTENPHPWLGWLTPDIAMEDGRKLTELLTAGRGVLVDFTEQQRYRQSAANWSGRVQVESAHSHEHPEVQALLVRPDGHAAWVGDNDSPEALEQALHHWHGTPAHN